MQCLPFSPFVSPYMTLPFNFIHVFLPLDYTKDAYNHYNTCLIWRYMKMVYKLNISSNLISKHSMKQNGCHPILSPLMYASYVFYFYRVLLLYSVLSIIIIQSSPKIYICIMVCVLYPISKVIKFKNSMIKYFCKKTPYEPIDHLQRLIIFSVSSVVPPFVFSSYFIVYQ